MRQQQRKQWNKCKKRNDIKQLNTIARNQQCKVLRHPLIWKHWASKTCSELPGWFETPSLPMFHVHSQAVLGDIAGEHRWHPLVDPSSVGRETDVTECEVTLHFGVKRHKVSNIAPPHCEQLVHRDRPGRLMIEIAMTSRISRHKCLTKIRYLYVWA